MSPHSRKGGWWGCILVPVTIALLWWAWPGVPSEEGGAPAPAAVGTPERLAPGEPGGSDPGPPGASAAPGALAAVANAEQRITALESENFRLQAELDSALAEADRQRDGLEACVDKLNQVSASAAAVPRRRASTAPRRPSGSRGVVRFHSGDRLRVIGEQAVVSGAVFSTATEDRTVTVVVELFDHGSQLDTAVLDVDVAAGGRSSWEAEFYIGSGTGRRLTFKRYME